MVHALTEIGRTLRAGGILLDIRPYLPFGPLELVQADEAHVIGRLDEVKSVPSDAAADEAIAEVSRRRLFDLEDTTSFYYSSYWDSVGEVQEYLRDWADEARLPRRLHDRTYAMAPHFVFQKAWRVEDLPDAGPAET